VAFVPWAADAYPSAKRRSALRQLQRLGGQGHAARALAACQVCRSYPPISATSIQRRSALRQYGCPGTRARKPA
jgi:hypothetical protein